MFDMLAFGDSIKEGQHVSIVSTKTTGMVPRRTSVHRREYDLDQKFSNIRRQDTQLSCVSCGEVGASSARTSNNTNASMACGEFRTQSTHMDGKPTTEKGMARRAETQMPALSGDAYCVLGVSPSRSKSKGFSPFDGGRALLVKAYSGRSRKMRHYLRELPS